MREVYQSTVLIQIIVGNILINYLVSTMLCLTSGLWLLKCDSVNAGSLRIENLSCSHAKKSSAKLIFLCVIMNFMSGKKDCDKLSKF